MFLNGRLYVWSSNSDLKPFKLVDPVTLNEIEGDELAAFNAKLDDIKRKEGDERNQNILEWSKDSFEEEKDKAGRYLCNSPMFTDGNNIYLVAQWKHMATEDGDESSEQEGEKELKVHRIKVEIYDS